MLALFKYVGSVHFVLLFRIKGKGIISTENTLPTGYKFRVWHLLMALSILFYKVRL